MSPATCRVFSISAIKLLMFADPIGWGVGWGTIPRGILISWMRPRIGGHDESGRRANIAAVACRTNGLTKLRAACAARESVVLSELSGYPICSPDCEAVYHQRASSREYFAFIPRPEGGLARRSCQSKSLQLRITITAKEDRPRQSLFENSSSHLLESLSIMLWIET